MHFFPEAASLWLNWCLKMMTVPCLHHCPCRANDPCRWWGEMLAPQRAVPSGLSSGSPQQLGSGLPFSEMPQTWLLLLCHHREQLPHLLCLPAHHHPSGHGQWEAPRESCWAPHSSSESQVPGRNLVTALHNWLSERGGTKPPPPSHSCIQGVCIEQLLCARSQNRLWEWIWGEHGGTVPTLSGGEGAGRKLVRTYQTT